MRICFVSPRLPWPTYRGDALRVYHQMKALSREHVVSLVCTADDAVTDEALAELQPICERVVTVPIGKAQAFANVLAGAAFSRLPLQVSFYRSARFASALRDELRAGAYDVVHVALMRMAPYVWDLQTPPVVFDLEDAHSLNVRTRLARAAPPMRPLYELEATRAARYEREICAHFREVLVTAPTDRDAIGAPNVTVLPNGVDLDAFSFARDGRDPNTIAFIGNMGYHPNVDGAVWFAENVWPLLKRSRPALKLLLVGARPAPSVQALATRFPDITVTGVVPSVTEYLHRAAVAVCPLRCGSGIQNKVLEAMSAGTPVVATTIANLGVAAHPDKELVIADEPDAFAAAVSSLLDAPARRGAIADDARRFVEAFSWRGHASALADIYRRAIANG